MTDSSRNSLDALAKVLLRCWIIGFVLLFVTLGAILLLGDTIRNLHGSMFGLSAHEFDVIVYAWMGLLKIAVLTFFFIPWLSITMVIRRDNKSQS